jgi:uncharacterized protein YdeI (YjbR/CyaY-like superfamily)
MKPQRPTPHFFKSPAALRAWFEANHGAATELHVGYHKAHTGAAGLTWPESVAAALCFGWIDGVRRPGPDGRGDAGGAVA